MTEPTSVPPPSSRSGRATNVNAVTKVSRARVSAEAGPSTRMRSSGSGSLVFAPVRSPLPVSTASR